MLRSDKPAVKPRFSGVFGKTTPIFVTGHQDSGVAAGVPSESILATFQSVISEMMRPINSHRIDNLCREKAAIHPNSAS